MRTRLNNPNNLPKVAPLSRGLPREQIPSVSLAHAIATERYAFDRQVRHVTKGSRPARFCLTEGFRQKQTTMNQRKRRKYARMTTQRTKHNA
jgi:hypothetical protein